MNKGPDSTQCCRGNLPLGMLDLRGNMNKFVALSILPLIAACSSSNSSGGTPAPTPAPGVSAEFIETRTPSGTVVSKSTVFDEPIATFDSGTRTNTSYTTMTGLSDGTDEINDRGLTAYGKMAYTNEVQVQTAAQGYSVKMDRVSGNNGGLAAVYRLYDPNDNLIAIETFNGTGTPNAVVGSVAYYGQWNGEVNGTGYEGGLVDVVVNGGTGQADLTAYFPNQAGTLIDEAAGTNTLTYDASTQTVSGTVTFTAAGSNTATATGQTVMDLTGTEIAFGGGNRAPQLLSGVAYTDTNEPFEANIGFIAGLDSN